MFRSLLIHRLRLVLTGLAIALGVAFMSGSFIFSATLRHSLDSLFAQASNGTDVEVGIAIDGHAVPFTITGITGYGSADSVGGGSMAIFSLGTAQRLFGQAGEFSQIIVKAAPGVSAAQLRDWIAAVLPPADRAVTSATASATAAEQTNSQLGALQFFFLGFAGIALFVGAFVIWNTFSILVGQRTRELALTRALGASTGQAFRSVLAQAAIIAAVASVAGAGLGLLMSRALGALLGSFGLSLPISGLQLPVAELVISIVTGIAITMIASLAPAWRATRIAPVQAMRDPAPEPARFGNGRLVTGLTLVAAGAAALLTGIYAAGGGALTAAGAACSFIGVLALAPLLVRPLAYLSSAPLVRLPGQVGVLARGNTMRNPKRTSATAAALMIGVLGTMLGLGLGAALAAALTRSEQATVSIPAGRLIIYILATAAVGVLARIGPARRAARLDVLTAIATE
jgi:putative ABC transport system permease protein